MCLMPICCKTVLTALRQIESHFQKLSAMATHILKYIPYKNKYWLGTKFGELANRHTITKFKFGQYFFYSISIVTLVAFESFCQINISPSTLFQQIAKY